MSSKEPKKLNPPMMFSAAALSIAIESLPPRISTHPFQSAPILVIVGERNAHAAWWLACKLPNVCLDVRQGWEDRWSVSYACEDEPQFVVESGL